MALFFFSKKLENGKTLYLAPLTERLLMHCADEIEDPSGYFLFERVERGHLMDVEILARVPTDDAAFRISRMMGME